MGVSLAEDYQALDARLRALELRLEALGGHGVPNQNTSTGSNVVFNQMLVGDRGTWTPAFAGTGTAGVFTYTNQDGYYYNISNMLFVFGRILISAIGTPPTGNMRITGLPYVSNATYYGGLAFTWISNFNYTAAALALTANTGLSQQYFDLVETFDNAVRVSAPAANFTNAACELRFFGRVPLA